MSEDFIGAATQGDVEKVRDMLEANPALAKAKDENGLSVIMKATYYGKKDVVALLLAANPELTIFEAAATGQTERVRMLIKNEPALVNTFSVDGFAPLGLAVFFGHLDTVNALLDGGAEINAPSRETMKVTPLHSAAAAKQTAIARVLISRGANVNATAVNDLTPLIEACANGNLELAKLLVEHSANVDAKMTDGKTALAYATEKNQSEMVKFLREQAGAER